MAEYMLIRLTQVIVQELIISLYNALFRHPP